MEKKKEVSAEPIATAKDRKRKFEKYVYGVLYVRWNAAEAGCRQRQRLFRAADMLRFEVKLTDNFTKAYINSAIEDLVPRLESALPAGDISAVFI